MTEFINDDLSQIREAYRAAPICKHCSRTIPAARAAYRAVYCSDACRLAAKHARQAESFRAVLPSTARCVICHQPFSPRDRKQVTCGGECAKTNKNRSRNQRLAGIRAAAALDAGSDPAEQAAPDDDGLGHLSDLGHANTPAARASRRSEAARIDAVVAAAAAAGTLGAITPGRSSQDYERRAIWSGSGIGCKKVG